MDEKEITYGDVKEMGKTELAHMGPGIPDPPAEIEDPVVTERWATEE